MAVDMQVAIAELRTVDHQFVLEHYHRWKDGSVKLMSAVIRRELLQELEPDARTTSADLRRTSAGTGFTFSQDDG